MICSNRELPTSAVWAPVTSPNRTRVGRLPTAALAKNFCPFRYPGWKRSFSAIHDVDGFQICVVPQIGQEIGIATFGRLSNCTMSVVIPVEMMPPVHGHRVRTAAIEKTPGMLFNKNSRCAFRHFFGS